ncbi:MAG TPA: biotin/lipoyl-binding protein, partial [Anaerolineae bacterium]|nr:biotin/lipoyl-binding protein [Anaerolineae bacterium]
MIAILLLTAACRSNSGSGEAYASAVEVKRGSVATVVQMAGQVVAVHSLELDLGSVSGRIVNLAVRTGQEVQAGQELLQLDTTGYQRTLREAEADLKAAEAALQAAQKGSGQGELARAEADLAMAQYGAEHTKMALTLAEESRTGPLKQQVADAAFALRVAQDELRLKEIGEGQAEIRRLEYDQAFRQRVLRDMSPDDPQRAETQKSLAETERA